jgi:hypothetical protein
MLLNAVIPAALAFVPPLATGKIPVTCVVKLIVPDIALLG